MNDKEINLDEIYIKLKNEIISFQRKYILLENLLSAVEGISYDMPVALQSPEGRAAFYTAVGKLVSEQFISPVGKKPNTIGGLYQKYRVNKDSKEKDNKLALTIIESIIPPAALDYYIKNQEDFIKDRVIIDILSNFLRKKNSDFVTMNERAYELFGDEKFFKAAGKNRSYGETVLKRLGLNYSSIGCQETVEPFFSFQKRDFHLQAFRKVYIIENKDTFWSFKQNIMDASASVQVDMLVYGEGRKIISSFKFMDEYDIDQQTDEFFYFGDLDPEGINIYCELADEYPQYKIVPFYIGYQAVFEIGMRKPPMKTVKQQQIKTENIDRFVTAFPQYQAVKIKKHLENGFYIPQEALSAAEMKERFGPYRK